MLAEWAAQEGLRVAILSRGYAGRYKTKVFEVSDGNGIHAGPEEAGDEAYLLAKRLPGIPVIVSKNRYLAGQHAHTKFKTNVFILDDGFQHIALKRDLDLVLVDAANPFGNGHLLPWGPLREPLSQLKRAHAVILTRSSQVKAVEDTSMIIKERFPEMPVFKGDHAPEQVVFPGQGTHHDMGVLKGKRVLAFAGIARPESFRESMIQLGADVLALKKYRDHHPFTGDDFRRLLAQKETLGADYLVTTEKDWVRLERIANGHPDLAYLTVRFNLLSGQDRFFQVFKQSIGRKTGF
jgi:tetraacyldisaccharide 4'-kinase